VSYNFVTIAGIAKIEFLSFCYRYLKTQYATRDKKIRINTAFVLHTHFGFLLLSHSPKRVETKIVEVSYKYGQECRSQRVLHLRLSCQVVGDRIRIIIILTEMYCSHQYLSINLKKVCHAHFNAHKPPKPVTPTIFMLDTYRLIQKKNLPRPP